MRLRHLLLIPSVMAAISAHAEDLASGTDSVRVPSREVSIIIHGDDSRWVSFRGRTFPLNGYRANFRETVGDMVLIEIPSGGNGCPSNFVWFDASSGSLSEKFGTCSDHAEVSVHEGIITVTMPSLNLSEGDVAFDYERGTISRRLIGLRESGVKQGDLSAWEGKHFSAYLSAPENESILIGMIGWDDLDLLRTLSSVGPAGMVIRDGYLEAEGF